MQLVTCLVVKMVVAVCLVHRIGYLVVAIQNHLAVSHRCRLVMVDHIVVVGLVLRTANLELRL